MHSSHAQWPQGPVVVFGSGGVAFLEVLGFRDNPTWLVAAHGVLEPLLGDVKL